MKYINKVSEDLVNEVIGGFLTRVWYVKAFIVRKNNDGFKVIYRISDKPHSLLVRDFDVDFGSKHMWCSALDKRWQVAMAKRFGNDYLDDLKKFLYRDFDKKSEAEQKEITDNLEEVSVKVYKDLDK